MSAPVLSLLMLRDGHASFLPSTTTYEGRPCRIQSTRFCAALRRNSFSASVE
jgi:hypothetical protein